MVSHSLHPDRLFPASAAVRPIAQRLYAHVANLPIISPHGHTDPRWFADNEPFSNATELPLTPDHYLFRMLCSQGIGLDELGVPRADGSIAQTDPRAAWRLFASHWYLFAGTPSRLWLDWVLRNVFDLQEPLSDATADAFFDAINGKLGDDEFRPRALFEQFNIEVLTTTESPLDTLEHHDAIRDSGWDGQVLTAYRPDPVVDPEFQGFGDSVARLGELSGEDTGSWQGYLRAHRARREFFKSRGATSTDHGHPSARTADLDTNACEDLFSRVLEPAPSRDDAELFRAQMLTEMAAMSIDDGLVMQIHPGSFRNHHAGMLKEFGRDKGFDIPSRTNYVRDLKPLLDKFGMDRRLSVILFTLDESTYSREIAPLAGVYPTLKLGPSWWFHDSPEGMRRFRKMTTETAGFYIAAYVRLLMTYEISPVTMEPSGMEHPAYTDDLLRRFANDSLGHRTWQIAMDGSQKLPQRLLNSIRAQLKRGGPIAGLSLAVAAWMRYVLGRDENNEVIDVQDPMADEFRAIASEALADPEDLVARFAGLQAIFGSDLAADRRFTSTLAGQFRELVDRGAVGAVQHYVASSGPS